jgi:hypothetical protein
MDRCGYSKCNKVIVGVDYIYYQGEKFCNNQCLMKRLS